MKDDDEQKKIELAIYLLFAALVGIPFLIP